MLARKFLIKALASILSSILMFASLFVMTRYVGYEYGLMMWGWALVGLFSVIADLGFDAASVKFISEGRDQNTCISTHLFVKMILVAIIAIFTLSYLAFSITLEALTPEAVSIVITFLIYYTVANIVWVLIRTFDGRLEVVRSSIIQVSDVALRSCLLIVLAFHGASAETLSLSYIVGAVFSAFIALYLFTKIKYRPTKPAFLKEYIVFAKPIAAGLLLITAVSFIDKIMVASFWSTTELGFYTAAMGVAYAATAIGVTLNYVLLPGFADLFSREERDSAQSLLWRSEKYLSMLFIPAVVFVMLFGDELALLLFGSGFAPAGTIISVLSLYIYLYILHGVLTQVLYSTNNSKLYRNATIAYAVSSLILLIVLVPENIGGVDLAGLGAVGAAAAITVGYLIFTILISYYVKSSAGFTLHKGLAYQFVAGGVVFAAAFIVNREDISGLLPLLLVLLLCYALFIVMLFLLKELTKSDMVFIKNALRPKTMDKK